MYAAILILSVFIVSFFIIQYRVEKFIYKRVKKIYDDVLESKRKLFPHITMNVLLIGTVFVIGGGVHTKAISAMTHGVLFFGGLIHFIYVIYLQHYYFKDTARILIDLGQQIKENEITLEELKRENKRRGDNLAYLMSPQELDARLRQLNLDLVVPKPKQIVVLQELHTIESVQPVAVSATPVRTARR